MNKVIKAYIGYSLAKRNGKEIVNYNMSGLVS